MLNLSILKVKISRVPSTLVLCQFTARLVAKANIINVPVISGNQGGYQVTSTCLGLLHRDPYMI